MEKLIEEQITMTKGYGKKNYSKTKKSKSKKSSYGKKGKKKY